MIADKIKALILDGIDFPNPDTLAAVEGLATASAELSAAGDEWDDVSPDDSDADEVADGVLAFAKLYAPISTPDTNTVAEEAFNKIFKGGSNEQTAAGKALFSAGLRFNIAANRINTLFSVAPGE